jgi:hypothetical protein
MKKIRKALSTGAVLALVFVIPETWIHKAAEAIRQLLLIGD